jgi:uncharacterized protein (TIGR02246 family)
MSESNLEDRAAIHDLFTRYCCALDNGEIEAVVDCFTVDAILKSPVIDISGRDEIRAFADRFAAQRAAGTQFRHMVSNIAVTITGNRAAASAYLLVLISKDGNHRSLPPGCYACELIKEDSGAAHCRQHDCAGALDLLRRASELARTNAGYAYVYAVALNSARCVRTGNGTAQ